jgi:hypothetical protein
MRRPIFILLSLFVISLAFSSRGFAQPLGDRRAFECVGTWDGAAPVIVEIIGGKVFQNGEEMPDASIGAEKIAYKKRDGADLFVTTIAPSTGRLTISVFQSPRKEEKVFLEGKCRSKS